MATYRMLVTDLDGTLLNREAKLSERNKAAVRRAVEKGIPIVLCSGRFPAEGLADFGRELGLDVSGNYYICGNGALLVDAATLAIVEGNYLPLSSAAELIRRAEAFPPELQPEQIHICTPKGFYWRGIGLILSSPTAWRSGSFRKTFMRFRGKWGRCVL